MAKNGIFGVFLPQIYEKVMLGPKSSKNVIKRPKNAKIAPFLVKNRLFWPVFSPDGPYRHTLEAPLRIYQYIGPRGPRGWEHESKIVLNPPWGSPRVRGIIESAEKMVYDPRFMSKKQLFLPYLYGEVYACRVITIQDTYHCCRCLLLLLSIIITNEISRLISKNFY